MDALEKLGWTREISPINGEPRYFIREDENTIHYIAFTNLSVGCGTVRGQYTEQPRVEPTRMAREEIRAILEILDEM